MEEFLNLLPPLLPDFAGDRDSMTWKWDPKMTFSVKSTYLTINDAGLRCPYAKVLWNIKASLKIRAFLWLIINKEILTWDNLRREKRARTNINPLCMAITYFGAVRFQSSMGYAYTKPILAYSSTASVCK